MKMKLRITITGPKVHDVGYRYFLMNRAMSARIRMFEAHNIEGDGREEVLVLVDGSEQEIKAFRALVEAKRPERAEVSRVLIEDYDGEVMRVGEYAQFCTTVQMNKAIPLLLDMKEGLKSMVDGQSEIVNEVRGLREDIAVQNDTEWQARMEKDIRIIKSKLGIR